MKRAALFGWLQVTLVALNTWQLANGKVLGAFLVGFLISLVWTSNVRSVVKSEMRVRVSYSVGAAMGTVTGIGLARLFY